MATRTRVGIVVSVFLLLAPVAALGQIFSSKAVCSPPLALYSSGPYVPVGGEACEHDGYIIWSAAGGSPQLWNSIISSTAPMNAGLMDVFDLMPADGSSTNLVLDSNDDGGSQAIPTNEVQSPMTPNQPQQIRLLGVYGEAPSYPTLSVGPIRVRQFCPDQVTCMNVRPQLSYIATSGGTPYFNLNVNTIWDEEFGSAFSAAVTVSNGNSGAGFFQAASFAVMNADTVTLSPNVCLYSIWSADPIVCKQTPPLAPLQNYGTDLRTLFGTAMIPAGFSGDTLLLKVCVSVPSQNKIGVVVYQFTALAATSVTVQPDVQ